MRDPDGELHIVGGELVRHLYHPLESTHFLYHSMSQSLVRDGRLIPFSFSSPVQIKSPLLEFVTMPYEWTDAQLRSGALLTLDMSKEIFRAGFELKDASAWNIIFDGTRPRICDHLSFRTIRSNNWWAFGQFVRHFIFPLWVSRLRGLRTNKVFRIHRDGLSPIEARNLLGLRRFFSRIWPLLVDMTGPTASSMLSARNDEGTTKRTIHNNLYHFCAWSLGSHEVSGRKGQYWRAYTETRSHYSVAASRDKKETVTAWLKLTRPKWVVDLGCNIGEFSQLAVEQGARVIAVDSDHDCLEQLYIQNSNNLQIYPVVADLSDIMGGNGWCGTEYPGLMKRLEGKADVLMMLAVLHHLAVSESIPLEKIAEFASIVTKKYLFIEFIGEEDLPMQRLAQQRNRAMADFSIDRQRKAFSSYFRLVADIQLAGTCRSLVLMEKI